MIYASVCTVHDSRGKPVIVLKISRCNMNTTWCVQPVGKPDTLIIIAAATRKSALKLKFCVAIDSRRVSRNGIRAPRDATLVEINFISIK